MTEEIAIEVLKIMKSQIGCFGANGVKETKELAIDTALKSLLEIQQYRSIGTVEECREAMERQGVKTPDIWGDGYDDEGNMIYDMYTCPNCGENYEIDYDHYDYCPKCGQRMDKSDKVFE